MSHDHLTSLNTPQKGSAETDISSTPDKPLDVFSDPTIIPQVILETTSQKPRRSTRSVNIPAKRTYTGSEEKRKRRLDSEACCLLLRNSTSVVWCRACRMAIKLECKVPGKFAYYWGFFGNHLSTRSHAKKEKEWRGEGGHLGPKEDEARELTPQGSIRLIKEDKISVPDPLPVKDEVPALAPAAPNLNLSARRKSPIELMIDAVYFIEGPDVFSK